MAQNASNYEIIVANTSTELEVSVNLKLADGYIPVGGVMVRGQPKWGPVVFWQAIYKPK